MPAGKEAGVFLERGTVPRKDMPYRYIGKRIPRVDAPSKVSGEAVYGADIRLEGLCYLKALRSPHPHALIRGMDPSEALKMEGVLSVLTWKDIPGENLCGRIRRDQPILAREKVRYVGEPVAAVIAESETIAQEAVNRIQVDYELLPPVLSAEEALKENAPILHGNSNLLKEFKVSVGDVEKGFSSADVIVENTYTTPFAEHACLEPEAGIARIDEEGRVCVYAPTQHAHAVARDISQILALSPERVRAVQTVTGGGFGKRNDVSVHIILALAAYRTRRPVKWVHTREESFLTTTKRHPAVIRYRTGATRDGRVIAVDVDILMDTGAYASVGPAVVTRAGVHAVGPYRVPHVRVRSRGVYTNHPIAGAMRGFGVPQVAFAHESQMDIVASELGISPLRLREINILKKGARTITGQTLRESVGIEKTLEAVQSQLLSSPFRRNSKHPYLRRGLGYSCAFQGVGNTGLVNHVDAKIKLLRDGRVAVLVGASELGQGVSTVFKQISAEALGVSLETIDVRTEDTTLTSDPDETSASKQTYMAGNAICRAAQNLIERLSALIAENLQTGPKDIAYSGGVFRVKKNGRPLRIPMAAVSDFLKEDSKSVEGIGNYTSQTSPLDPETGQGIAYATYSYATQIAEVEVDTRTGKVRVIRIISANDIGKAINPGTVEEQIEGGVVMGLGYALMENYVPGKTKNFREYLIPTCCDMPKIFPVIVEDREPSGPFGAKGLGEITLNPTAAAISNAVYDAVGVRLFQLPITSERIYEALKKQALRKSEKNAS